MKQYIAEMRPIPTGRSMSIATFKDTTYAKHAQEAKQILESRHPGRKAWFVTEIKQPASPQKTTRPAAPPPPQRPRQRIYSRKHLIDDDSSDDIGAGNFSGNVDHSSYESARTRTSVASGCLGLIIAGLALIGLITFVRFFTVSTNHSLFPSESEIASPVAPDQTAVTPVSTTAPALDPAPDLQIPLKKGDEEASNRNSVIVSFPYQAVIVDRRDSIVLQSEPRMLSKNVIRIPTGAQVRAATNEGKWIMVETADGAIGYVRRKQLEFSATNP
ncbi:hypothetical protein FNZ56_03670 [Pseudoluteimonas lycopersici]|uniref:SH3 domain-containing protein n=1 Tax=Pseudoluteimonas lycopersici TaxID=1324796 RepID=A0A516V3D1_9GAMM|nr:hypothetical protein [Lysobacter lycopersici]QDQ73030.1 hypothetical protein FNZ56_03670 [Lysobacter lycopersici]